MKTRDRIIQDIKDTYRQCRAQVMKNHKIIEKCTRRMTIKELNETLQDAEMELWELESEIEEVEK